MSERPAATRQPQQTQEPTLFELRAHPRDMARSALR